MKLRLTKADSLTALDDDFVQKFYQDLQVMIWPLNREANLDQPWYVEANVNRVEKGVFEATADSMRRIAKNKAKDKATSDFIDFLGEDFKGTWRLQKVDFTQRQYSDVYTSSVEKAIAGEAPSGDLIPATLKLEPLSMSVSGNFYFSYNQ